MRRTRGRVATRFVVIAFATAAALVACMIYRPDRALRTATGTAAHDLCSETFVSQLDPKQNFAESLAPRPLAYLHPRWQTPALAVLVLTCWSIILVVGGLLATIGVKKVSTE